MVQIVHTSFSKDTAILKVYVGVLLTLLPGAALADRTIVTPSGYTMSSGYDAELFHTSGGHARTVAFVSTATSNLQINTAYATRSGKDRLSVGVQALLLPETFQTPSVSIGISDLANSSGSFAADGFYGRSYFFALSKSLDSSLNPPRVHGVTLTGGLSGGGAHGLFGGVGAILPLNLLGTAEYDSRSMNYRLAIKASPVATFSIVRIGGTNWIGFDFHSKVSL